MTGNMDKAVAVAAEAMEEESFKLGFLPSDRCIPLARAALTAALPHLGAQRTGDVCIDCNGIGRYPTGHTCKSCGGSGLVLPGDGIPTVQGQAWSAADAFDLGFNWARRLTGQNVEDSRAVGRTLLVDDFAKLRSAGLDVDAVPSFASGDDGIVAAKREIMRVLAAAPSPPADSEGKP